MARKPPTPRTGRAPARRTPPRPAPARPARRPPGRPARRPPRVPRARARVRLGNPGRRLRAALTVLALVMALLVARLVQVQGFEARSYAAAAKDERLRTVQIPAIRGTIFDRDGDVLARSVEARTVTADPTLIADPAQYANLLAPHLGVPEAELAGKLRDAKLADPPRRFVVLAKEVDPMAARAVAETIDPGTGEPIVGIFAEPESKRLYPADELAANVIGFLNSEGVGRGGIEAEFNRILAGEDGTLTYERDRRGGRIATAGGRSVEPVPGHDVQLTIDRDIQYAAQRAIAEQVAQTRSESGTVIVQDVRTGEILAMATAPTFDPNNPGRGPDINRGNRALSQIYEPGSIAKIMTMAAVIEEGAATPATKLKVPGALRRGGTVIHDHVGHGMWRLTLAGVLAKSSNIGTVLAADQIGSETLHRYLKAFGIDEPTGIQFPGESDGLLTDARDWHPTTAANIPFGQGFSLNTVQASSMFATIGNGGVRISPSLVRSWVDEDGRRHVPPPPETRRVVSEQTAEAVARMMETVTAEGGTAPKVQIPGYRVGGKTGTAEFADPECGCYRGTTASFAGIAPADEPRLAISVTLHKPKRGSGGGALGGPVFVDVMEFALRSLGVPPTGEKPSRMPIEW